MAYITFKNMEEYQAKINKLAKKSKALCKQVVYDGTGVMADAMKEALRDLPIEEGKNGPAAVCTAWRKTDRRFNKTEE